MKKTGRPGFTLLEVMVAMAIIAIALTAVLGSQSQSVSLANEAKFITTAAFLAQGKMAIVETKKADDLVDDSGDFGVDFPGYTWEIKVQDVEFENPENVSDYLKQIDLMILWSEDSHYQYSLRLFRFFPKS